MPTLSPATRHFLRHYAEMVVAMFLGMAVLGYPVDWAMDRLGASSDEFMVLGMAITMTVPMVGWMMYRGHGWRANVEMSASMFVPTFAVIGVLAAGLLTDLGVLMIVEHVVMLLAMAGVMLLRPEEYSHHHGHDAGQPGDDMKSPPGWPVSPPCWRSCSPAVVSTSTPGKPEPKSAVGEIIAQAVRDNGLTLRLARRTAA